MKAKPAELSQQYADALRKHLANSRRNGLEVAGDLGRQAVRLKLETLDLARIHEESMAGLEADGITARRLTRARAFFTEAIAPIEETHRAARRCQAELNRLNVTLNRRTIALATANGHLQQGVVKRKTVEAALKNSGKHYAKLLKESLDLQQHLRRLTHQVLIGQENERHDISRELQDEIGQTLLGINVRLVSMKREAWTTTDALKKEIASTQKLVVKSANSVRQFARTFKRA